MIEAALPDSEVRVIRSKDELEMDKVAETTEMRGAEMVTLSDTVVLGLMLTDVSVSEPDKAEKKEEVRVDDSIRKSIFVSEIFVSTVSEKRGASVVSDVMYFCACC